jgi:hypothetical protein
MSWHFSRALVEAFSEATCLDGEPSAPSSGSPTPQAGLCYGNCPVISETYAGNCTTGATAAPANS